MKSVVTLPRETIEARFTDRRRGRGASPWSAIATEGVGGGGFLYTNTDSLSVGVVGAPGRPDHAEKVVTDVFDHFLEPGSSPRTWRAASCTEYALPPGGRRRHDDDRRDRHGRHDGRGDAAGLTLNTGLTVHGMDLTVDLGGRRRRWHRRRAGRGRHVEGGAGRLPGEVFRVLRRPRHEDLREGARLPRTRAHVQEHGRLLANVLYHAFSLDTRPRRHLLSVARGALSIHH